MLKPRVIIRSLKHASLVLIALPEPITTAIGVVLLGITFYVSHALSKVIEKSLSVQARERLTNYFAHFRHFGNGDGAAVGVAAEARQSEPVRVRKTGDGDLKADLRSSILIGLPDEGRNSLHHTLDHKSLARCYGLDDSPVVKPVAPIAARRSGTDHSSETGAGVSVHHAIDRKNLYRRYRQPAGDLPVSKPVAGYVRAKNTVAKAVSAGSNSPSGEQSNDAPPVHHAVNMKHLQKRFGPQGRKSPQKVYREDFDLTGVFSSF